MMPVWFELLVVTGGMVFGIWLILRAFDPN